MKEEVKDIMKSLQTFLKFISDETRLRVLLLLAEDSLCVCEINGILEVPQPTVSKILSRCRDLGWVKDVRNGKYIYYELTLSDSLHKSILSSIIERREEIEILSRDIKNLEKRTEFLETCQISTNK